jgi:hypothetical protein
MEATATDTVWVRKVENLNRQSALINVRSREGVVEATLGIEESLGIREGVSIKLKGISETFATALPYCDSCGRGDKTTKKRLIAQAKVEVSAPKEVQIFRDDIISTKK